MVQVLKKLSNILVKFCKVMPKFPSAVDVGDGLGRQLEMVGEEENVLKHISLISTCWLEATTKTSLGQGQILV